MPRMAFVITDDDTWVPLEQDANGWYSASRHDGLTVEAVALVEIVKMAPPDDTGIAPELGWHTVIKVNDGGELAS